MVKGSSTYAFLSKLCFAMNFEQNSCSHRAEMKD